MNVVHAIWDDTSSRFHVWSEESSRLPLLPKKIEEANVGDLPLWHPFVLSSVEDLFGMMSRLTNRLTEKEAGQLTLRLPSTVQGPLPSPEILLDEPTSTKKTYLRQWRVPSLVLRPGAAFELLLALPDQAPLGIAFGSSLYFWTTVTRFALELLYRQAYAPALSDSQEEGQSVSRAEWQVILMRDDQQRVEHLAKLMPPVCWSFLPAGKITLSTLQEMILRFLQQVIDAFVREHLLLASSEKKNASRRAVSTRSLPEKFLYALSSHDAIITGKPAALKIFLEKMQNWLGQLWSVESDAPFRTCFRLDPPPEEQQEERWSLHFYLQANDDPSLLVPAEEVWTGRSGTLKFLKRRFEQPQERLLADLARASRLFPPIEESLKTALPRRLELQTEQAYRFLREAVPLLEQSGFAVLVPPWWKKPAARVGVKMIVKPEVDARTNSGLLGLDSLVSYDVQVAIGDMKLSMREFQKLVDLKVPLIKVRGQWVELRPDQIDAVFSFLRKRRDTRKMTMGEVLYAEMGEYEAAQDVPVLSIDAEGWVKDMLGQLTQKADLTPIPIPGLFKGQLRPYQVKGVSWLAFLKRWGLGGCLADSMGLGKCITGDSLLVVNGLLQKAEDLWQNYASQLSSDGEGEWAMPRRRLRVNALDEARQQVILAPLRHLYRQWIAEPLRIVWLEDGSRIMLTMRHRLLTERGWVNDLRCADTVYVPAQMQWGGHPIDLDLIKLLAWQVAFGKETSRLCIVHREISLLEDLRQCLVRVGKKYTLPLSLLTIYVDECRQYAELRLVSESYRRFLVAKGYQWGSSFDQKSIPACVMRADQASIRVFLQHFFEARASLDMQAACIILRVSSSLLFEELKYLLRRCNIHLYVDHSETREYGVDGDQEYCGVVSGEMIRAFYHQIGFVSDEKQEQLTELYTRLGASTGEAGVQSPVLPLKIRAIDEVFYEGWVYDFEVEHYHNFVANMILCHNTVQLITFLLHEHEQQAIDQTSGPTLLICPMSIVGNWQKEVQRFGPSLKTMVHYGPQRLSKELFEQEALSHNLVITTYALALRDKELLARIAWNNVVLDEAQNIKNETAKQTQAIKQLRARQRIALTGTPVENRLAELWSIMEFLNPGYLGSGSDFRKSFVLPIERYHDPERAETLKRLIQPFVLRRLKTDKSIIEDLPEKMEMKVYCNLTQEQASLYEAVVKDMLQRIEEASGIERKGLVLSTLMKLKQICNHPAQFMGDGSSLAQRSGKLTRLQEMLEEVLAADEKALIFTQYAQMGSLLQRHLQQTLNREVLFLHGETPKKQRDLLVQRFQEERGKAPLFVLSLKAGGVGLNLTAANHVFHFDRWWNPAVENQATDRAFRIGQTRNVQVHMFLCAGTLEERIDQMIEQKRELAESIVGSGEQWLTEMSTAQLKEVLMLSRDAVTE